MKPSHRKDVIIARIIFAFICVAFIAIIVSIVLLISSHFGKSKVPVQDTQKQTESEEDDTVYEDVPIVTPETEVVEQKVIVKTTASVNLRTEPDKDSEVQTVVPEGTELIVILEQDGWAKVGYAGYEGYVYTEYIQQVAADASTDQPESDEDTAGSISDIVE